MSKSCLVVNLFGAPSAGKSTGAAYIFSKLKMAGYNAELVTEFAKDMCWEENDIALSPDGQIYIYGQQCYRLLKVRDKVDVIITDSPLFLSIFYNKSLGDSFKSVVLDCFNSYDNVNFFLERAKPYNPVGRVQTEAESDIICNEMRNKLIENNIPFEVFKGNIEGYDSIYDKVMSLLSARRESDE